MNALERYNSQDQDRINTMQEPVLTNNGLYVWETWTIKNTTITSIMHFAEDKDGGNTMRISTENYLNFIK